MLPYWEHFFLGISLFYICKFFEIFDVGAIPDQVNRDEILISQGDRPWWQRLIAAVFFTVTVVFLFYFFILFDFRNQEMLEGSFGALNIAIITFSMGIGFSVYREYHFNFQERKYKVLACVGVVKLGEWKQFEKLDYISVFKNNSKDLFEINLWYNENKHFNISIYFERDTAIFLGKQLARKLNIDLLDATDPYNSKWVVDLDT